MGTFSANYPSQSKCFNCGSDQVVPQLTGSPSQDATVATFMGLLVVSSSATGQIKWRCMNCMTEFDVFDHDRYDNLVEQAIAAASVNSTSTEQLRQSWQGKVALQHVLFCAAGLSLTKIKLTKEQAGPPSMKGLEYGKWVEFDWNADQFENIQFFIDTKQLVIVTHYQGECTQYLCSSHGDEVDIRKVDIKADAT